MRHILPVLIVAYLRGISFHSFKTLRSRACVPVALDVLLRLTPIGIIVIDHRYQILFFNRAAHKLLTLQIQEERQPDFFHVIAGLPYQEVRAAIDTVVREGTSLAEERRRLDQQVEQLLEEITALTEQPER